MFEITFSILSAYVLRLSATVEFEISESEVDGSVNESEYIDRFIVATLLPPYVILNINLSYGVRE
jgi:hypothetical protein